MSTETSSQPLYESLDYGHSLEFGYFLVPDAGDPLGVLETARLADGLGAAAQANLAIDRAARPRVRVPAGRRPR